MILDDCPDDDREKIVKSYKDKRIKYSKNEKNLGITPSRNKLIDMAQGEYLAIFDHDDISMPERFAKQVAYLDKHPKVGVVSAKVIRMSNGHPSRNPTEDHDIKLALMRSCALNHTVSMVRKKVLTDNNIRYEERFSPAEDYALWCRLIPYTEFYNLNDEVLLKYRDHINNTSHKQSKKMEQAGLAVCSFVSVTQHFNTCDSMGKLTLNILLSFAQFERELGAERVRDKIAASKKKGMWTGGPVPLGPRLQMKMKTCVASTIRAIRTGITRINVKSRRSPICF